MGSQLSALVLSAVAVVAGSSAGAQDSTAPPEQSTQAAQISDDELQTFAQIYTDLQDSKSKHEAALAAATSEDEAGKIRDDFQRESGETLSKHGWTVDRFNSLVRTINADPELAERASALIR